MKTSKSIAEISKALVSFQKGLKSPKLDGSVEVRMKSGGSYNFKYATFSEIIKTVREPLAKNGLGFVQLVGEDATVTTMLFHESGEYIRSRASIGTLQNKNPQESGSLISYLKRYSLSAMLGIVAEDDDDGNIASGNGYSNGTSKSKTAKKKNKPWLNSPKIEKARKAIDDSETTLKKILEKYKISRNGQAYLKGEAELEEKVH